MPNLLGRRIPASAIVQAAPRPGTSSSLAPQAPQVVGGSANAPSGVGDVLAALGKNFQNGTARALQQEQLTKLADANELTRIVAGSIGADGAITNPQNASIAAALGALDPNKFGRMAAIQAATTGGVDSQKAAEYLTGLGEYRNTPLYGERDFANKVTMQGMQEATKLRMNEAQEATKLRLAESTLEQVDTPEGPKFVRRGDAVGQSPILGLDQRKGSLAGALIPTLTPQQQQDFVLGRAPAPEVYNATRPDGSTVPATVGPSGGIVDLNTGEKIPQVTTMGRLQATTADGLGSSSTIGKEILEGRINTERAVKLIDNLSTELEKPNAGVSVGFLGSVSEVANNIRSQVEAGAKAAGGLSARDEMRGSDPRAVEIRTTVDRVMNENQQQFRALQQQGIDTAKIRALIEDLAYAQAKANDPSGRVSNQDVERAGRQVGMGLGDPVAMKSVLGDLRERTIQGQEIRERNSAPFLGSGKTVPAWDFLAGRKAPPAATAGAAPSAAPGNLKQKYGLE